MNFLFHLRSDAIAKPGGDAALGRQFKALLERAGHRVNLSTSTVVGEGAYDAALTFNLDRPFESAQFMRHCQRRGIPVMLYCLHHPAPGVVSYLRGGTVGFRRFFAVAAGYRPDAYESLLTLAKVAGRKFRARQIGDLAYIDTRRAQRYLLAHADVLIGASALEVAEIAREFDAPGAPYAVVPHILETLTEVPAGAPALTRDIDVLCAGRIESRKNQLQVARLARLFPGARFVFIGTPSPSEQRYFAGFSQAIDGLKNVEYFPSMPIDELRAMFRRARIFISLSWFEVVSLTEMDAYANGCRLLVGKHSYAQEFVTGRAYFVDPGDFAAARAELARMLDAPRESADFDAAREPALMRMAPAQVLHSFMNVFQKLGIAG